MLIYSTTGHEMFRGILPEDLVEHIIMCISIPDATVLRLEHLLHGKKFVIFTDAIGHIETSKIR